MGVKTRSVTGPAPLNLVGGYRFSNATEIEADLAGYIRATEACLLRDECVVELPTVESPPLISPDPFDIPSFLDRRVTAASSVAAPSMSCLQTVPDLGRAHCRCLEILDCSGTKRCACQH
jgi:hypothetical protein